MIKQSIIISRDGLPEEVGKDIDRLRSWQRSGDCIDLFRWQKGDEHYFMGEGFPGNLEEIPEAYPDEDEEGDWICTIEHLFPNLGAYLAENNITKCSIDFRY